MLIGKGSGVRGGRLQECRVVRGVRREGTQGSYKHYPFEVKNFTRKISQCKIHFVSKVTTTLPPSAADAVYALWPLAARPEDVQIAPTLLRRAHFLGAKLRSLRKRHAWTLEEVSTRCARLDPANAPSVSYLSMIETGKRVPSPALLTVLADVFQKPSSWFLDEAQQGSDAEHEAERVAGADLLSSFSLEPKALFSDGQLEHALPELLSQTGTTGYQFAQLLIRTFQEARHNSLPDLERAAESVGHKRFPLETEDLFDLADAVGLRVRWFDRSPFATTDRHRGEQQQALVRSFFDPPNTVYLNRQLQQASARVKYDLATHIGHQVLHGGDGKRSFHTTGGWGGGSAQQDAYGINSQEVLFAWRDFECGFFADALLCPRVAYREFLLRNGY
ncbi:MAG: helix-turn-helix transcriptional regulator, partial [Pseudomonadota bacterium]